MLLGIPALTLLLMAASSCASIALRGWLYRRMAILMVNAINASPKIAAVAQSRTP